MRSKKLRAIGRSLFIGYAVYGIAMAALILFGVEFAAAFWAAKLPSWAAFIAGLFKR